MMLRLNYEPVQGHDFKFSINKIVVSFFGRFSDVFQMLLIYLKIKSLRNVFACYIIYS